MLRERLKNTVGIGDLVGQSAEMHRLYRIISRVASGKHPVLLLGERGAGKATVARAIHSQGPSCERPFVVVDCASATEGQWSARAAGGPEELGGTVFLNEVWALSPVLQANLVRTFQEREIRPVGSGRAFFPEARIIAASSRDLELSVQQGTFRRDLYFRLNVVSLRLPALRDRKEDIALLAEHFLERFGIARGMQYAISGEAMKVLLGYDWPGNVLELKDCVEYAATASSGPVLKADDLPLQIQRIGSAHAGNGTPIRSGKIMPLAEVEKQTILHALEQLNGDKRMTARVLGIGKTTLYRKLKEYGIAETWISRPAVNR